MPIEWNQTIATLRRFCREHGRSPSFEEVRKLFKYRSKNAAFWLVKRLVEKGVLKQDTSGKILARALEGVRLLGSIQAGWPSPAEEELIDTLSLDEYLVRSPEQTYLIKVTGDSMTDAGIHPGDLVL